MPIVEMTRTIFRRYFQSIAARWLKANWLDACRRGELDVVLQELERAEKIKLTEVKGKLIVG